MGGTICRKEGLSIIIGGTIFTRNNKMVPCNTWLLYTCDGLYAVHILKPWTNCASWLIDALLTGYFFNLCGELAKLLELIIISVCAIVYAKMKCAKNIGFFATFFPKTVICEKTNRICHFTGYLCLTVYVGFFLNSSGKWRSRSPRSRNRKQVKTSQLWPSEASGDGAVPPFCFFFETWVVSLDCETQFGLTWIGLNKCSLGHCTKMRFGGET